MGGLTARPLSTAFLARRPAATITLGGLLVLVQLVIAAMTTSPSLSVSSLPPLTLIFEAFRYTCPFEDLSWDEVSRYFRKLSPILPRGTRCCGRLGPATLLSTVERSRSITSE